MRRSPALRSLLRQALGLLLDEPSQKPDIDSIRWLEKFLHAYEGVLITISHDRSTSLNAICTHIADIELQDHHRLPGSATTTWSTKWPGEVAGGVGEHREEEEESRSSRTS